MIDFKSVKSLVTAREAAEHYGLTVNRHGMALCPFNDDHNPSMKLDEHLFPVSWKLFRIWHDLSPPGTCGNHEAVISKCMNNHHLRQKPAKTETRSWPQRSFDRAFQ
ncbi:MAG: hypothetical protein IJI06_06080 [Oscillospiraceae bacterium]|nr:hypothetical protein [Oscillospiraceae bacterium]